MGTYALGCFLQDERAQGASAGDEKARALIRDLRNRGKLRALPIVSTNKETGALVAADGTELREHGGAGSGRWVRIGALEDGAVRYLGSATHAGHIEFKALWVLSDGRWYNILTNEPDPSVGK